MERSQIIDIKQFNTFYDINYHSIDRLIQFGQIKHIKKNTLIIEEKQKNENIFFLLQGIAYNYCLFENDSKRILNIENQEHFLNEDAIYQEYASSNIKVLKNSTILVIPISIIKELIHDNFLFSQKIQSSLASKYTENQNLLKFNSYQNSQARLTIYLCYLAHKLGIPYQDDIEIPFDFSVVFLSQLIGAKRETTSRILNQLIDQDFIYYHQKHLVIKNLNLFNRLKSIAFS